MRFLVNFLGSGVPATLLIGLSIGQGMSEPLPAGAANQQVPCVSTWSLLLFLPSFSGGEAEPAPHQYLYLQQLAEGKGLTHFLVHFKDCG